MKIVFLLLAGCLLANCIPHIVKGLTGQRFRVPLRQKVPFGNPVINVVWGSFNLILGINLLFLGMEASETTFLNGNIALIGFFSFAILCAYDFGKKEGNL